MSRAEKEITVEVVGKVSAVAILRILIVIENVCVFIREALGFIRRVPKKFMSNIINAQQVLVLVKAQFEHN